MIKHIYLVRHGETIFNKQVKIQGSGMDSPLTSLGEEQAKKLLERFKTNNFNCDLVFSSPIGRALQTAGIITSYMEKNVIQDDLLKEINCGDVEGDFVSSIDPQKLEKLRTSPDEKYPGGECVEDVILRAKQFLEKLESYNDKSVLIISHGNFIRCFIAAATQMPSMLSMRIFIDNTSLSYLYYFYSYYRLITLNDISHLSPIPLKTL
ncbi:MAG: histidine phosphatase family protein [Leptospiraceae bacterium]|nr:histidine phosphatase family protein [Leptospiraceae bacterium]